MEELQAIQECMEKSNEEVKGTRYYKDMKYLFAEIDRLRQEILNLSICDCKIKDLRK